MLFILLAPLLNAGTGVKPPPKALLTAAAKEVGGSCDAKTLSATLLGRSNALGMDWDAYEVSGCDTTFIMSWDPVGYPLRFSDFSLRKRAPFDLNCDAPSVKYTYIDAVTRGVEGCGNRATYLYTDQVGWVANLTAK